MAGPRRGSGSLRIPIAREGWPFIIIIGLPTIAAFWLTDLWWLKLVLLALTVFVVAFFRDPERVVPVDPSSIVSPADGRVIKVERVTDFKFLKDEALKISIFMNLFNVHVNRAPASAKVLKVIYNPGKFFNASHDKASMENEQNAVIAEGPTGRRFVFNQIAGLVARRIVCHAAEGDSLVKGERFGMIRFGSRLDVYLPLDCKVSVRPGERVKAGSSILGYWGG
jgi:phosphatidylserine decarboxylase